MLILLITISDRDAFSRRYHNDGECVAMVTRERERESVAMAARERVLPWQLEMHLARDTSFTHVCIVVRAI